MYNPGFSISRSDFILLLKQLSADFRVVTLHEVNRLYPKGEAYLKEKTFAWKEFLAEEAESIVFEGYRASAPIKAFFFKANEKIATYPKPTETLTEKPYCIVGVKSCDLKSFITEDHVFLKGNYPDPQYQFYRDRNLIISSDCSEFKSVCYCLHLNIQPYPTAGFDINISVVSDDFVIEVGSEKGKACIEKYARFFKEATKEQLSKRDRNRQNLVNRLQKSIDAMQMPASQKWPQLVREKEESQVWKDQSLTCVECGACTQICPTCHCFLLGDQKAAFGFERFKIWDSCQYNGFARVAGGASPRPKRFQRLRNRYVKKFDYFPATMNEMACTGCGRCIEGCPGKIDMRKIFSSLDKS